MFFYISFYQGLLYVLDLVLELILSPYYMLALGNFKSGVSTPKDSLWQKVHVSLRGLSAICNKI